MANAAQMSARLKAGKAGIYRKTMAKVIAGCNGTASVTDKAGNTFTVPCITLNRLFSTGTDTSNSAPPNIVTASYPYGFTFRGEVKCASARVRVAMGVSYLLGVRNIPPGAGISFPGDTGLAWANILPTVRVEGLAGRGPQPDVSGGMYGVPIYSLAKAPNVYFGPLGPDDVWPAPAYVVNGEAPYVAIPLTYEAVSMATDYRVQGGFGGQANDSFFGPLYLWASWEIVDPRDAEDSEAILADCTLDCGPGTPDTNS